MVFRASAVGILIAVVAATTLLFEFTKQLIHPDITAWESHLTTTAFFAITVGVAGYVLLRKRDVLYSELLEAAHEREDAAAETARANALLRAVLESNRDGVLVVGFDGSVTTFNSRFLQIWGISESTLRLPTAELFQVVHSRVKVPADFTSHVVRLHRDRTSEATSVIEFHDGRMLEEHTELQLVDGVPVGRVWRYRDITANREAQSQIRMLAQTLRSVSECISVTDVMDRVIFVNQSFLKTYGYEEAELIGQSVAFVRSPRTPEDVGRQILPATLAGGWRGEIWNRRKDGTEFPILLSTSIVRDEEGIPVALVGVARDITEDKRTEEALRRGRESEGIVTLAAGIAHEFNNVLQTVLGNTSLVIGDLPADSSSRDPLRAVIRASERAANLTAQLLSFAGRGAFVDPVEIDLNQQILERIAAFRPMMPESVTLETDLTGAIGLIRADEGQVGQMLRSLTTNAAEAMIGRTGAVTLRTRVEALPSLKDRRHWATAGISPGRYACLTVEDQGVGMDAETIAKIFDPFFSTKFLGRGMGLPAVLGIVRSLGGAVAVDSEPGAGTRVTVAIPVSAGGPAH